MASRKIQKSKSGSYLVTLPKSWVEKVGLEKGSRIGIKIREDGSLELTPSLETTRPKSEFDLKVEDYPDDRALENMMRACYMQGGEEIRISSKEGTITEKKERLREILPGLIASEVAQDRPNKFIIRVLADPTSFSVNDLFARISDLIFSIHHDTVRALQEQKTELASDASYRGGDIDRLYRLTLRQLVLSMEDRQIASSMGISDRTESLLYAISARDLSRMGYHVRRAANIVGELKLDLGSELIKPFIDMSEIFSDMLENAVNALTEGNSVLANEVFKDMEKIRRCDRDTTNKILKESLKAETSFNLTSLSSNWRRASGHAVAVADVATNLAASDYKQKK